MGGSVGLPFGPRTRGRGRRAPSGRRVLPGPPRLCRDLVPWGLWLHRAGVWAPQGPALRSPRRPHRPAFGLSVPVCGVGLHCNLWASGPGPGPSLSLRGVWGRALCRRLGTHAQTQTPDRTALPFCFPLLPAFPVSPPSWGLPWLWLLSGCGLVPRPCAGAGGGQASHPQRCDGGHGGGACNLTPQSVALVQPAARWSGCGCVLLRTPESALRPPALGHLQGHAQVAFRDQEREREAWMRVWAGGRGLLGRFR